MVCKTERTRKTQRGKSELELVRKRARMTELEPARMTERSKTRNLRQDNPSHIEHSHE